MPANIPDKAKEDQKLNGTKNTAETKQVSESLKENVSKK